MRKNLGFTLMELLIVIGVLAILAAGLLAAIDPFEQLKKARDANNRNAAIETVNAFTRYYATHGDFPWNQATPPLNCTQVDVADLASGNTVFSSDADVQACITSSLIDADGELKTTFFDGLRTTLLITSSGRTSLQVCFNPESKAQRNDTVSTTYYYLDGTTDNPVKEARDGDSECDGNLDACYQCFQ